MINFHNLDTCAIFGISNCRSRLYLNLSNGRGYRGRRPISGVIGGRRLISRAPRPDAIFEVSFHLNALNCQHMTSSALMAQCSFFIRPTFCLLSTTFAMTFSLVVFLIVLLASSTRVLGSCSNDNLLSAVTGNSYTSSLTTGNIFATSVVISAWAQYNLSFQLSPASVDCQLTCFTLGIQVCGGPVGAETSVLLRPLPNYNLPSNATLNLTISAFCSVTQPQHTLSKLQLVSVSPCPSSSSSTGGVGSCASHDLLSAISNNVYPSSPSGNILSTSVIISAWARYNFSFQISPASVYCQVSLFTLGLQVGGALGSATSTLLTALPNYGLPPDATLNLSIIAYCTVTDPVHTLSNLHLVSSECTSSSSSSMAVLSSSSSPSTCAPLNATTGLMSYYTPLDGLVYQAEYLIQANVTYEMRSQLLFQSVGHLTVGGMCTLRGQFDCGAFQTYGTITVSDTAVVSGGGSLSTNVMAVSSNQWVTWTVQLYCQHLDPALENYSLEIISVLPTSPTSCPAQGQVPQLCTASGCSLPYNVDSISRASLTASSVQRPLTGLVYQWTSVLQALEPYTLSFSLSSSTQSLPNPSGNCSLIGRVGCTGEWTTYGSVGSPGASSSVTVEIIGGSSMSLFTEWNVGFFCYDNSYAATYSLVVTAMHMIYPVVLAPCNSSAVVAPTCAMSSSTGQSSSSSSPSSSSSSSSPILSTSSSLSSRIFSSSSSSSSSSRIFSSSQPSSSSPSSAQVSSASFSSSTGSSSSSSQPPSSSSSSLILSSSLLRVSISSSQIVSSSQPSSSSPMTTSQVLSSSQFLSSSSLSQPSSSSILSSSQLSSSLPIPISSSQIVSSSQPSSSMSSSQSLSSSSSSQPASGTSSSLLTQSSSAEMSLSSYPSSSSQPSSSSSSSSSTSSSSQPSSDFQTSSPFHTSSPGSSQPQTTSSFQLSSPGTVIQSSVPSSSSQASTSSFQSLASSLTLAVSYPSSSSQVSSSQSRSVSSPSSSPSSSSTSSQPSSSSSQSFSSCSSTGDGSVISPSSSILSSSSTIDISQSVGAQSQESTSDGIGNAALAGVVVGSVCGLSLLILIVYIFYARYHALSASNKGAQVDAGVQIV